MNHNQDRRFQSLLTRRLNLQNEIFHFELQAESPERYIRVAAHSALDALYLEENYINKDIQRLLKKAYAINVLKKIFNRK